MKINESTGLQGIVRIYLDDKLVHEQHNMIVTAGKVAIARRLGNLAAKTSEGMVTYGATGTGSTAVALTDTVLDTELARKAIAGSYVSNVVTISTFFTTAESNGTITEFGLFGEEATAAADSGTLFERIVLPAAIVKTVSMTLTVEVIITIG